MSNVNAIRIPGRVVFDHSIHDGEQFLSALFDHDCPWLLAVDGTVGLDRAALQRLDAWLTTGRLPARSVEEGVYEAPDFGSSTPG